MAGRVARPAGRALDDVEGFSLGVDRDARRVQLRSRRADGAEGKDRKRGHGAEIARRGIVGVDNAEARDLPAIQALLRSREGGKARMRAESAEELGLVGSVLLPGPMELEVLPRDVGHQGQVEIDVAEAVGARRETVGRGLDDGVSHSRVPHGGEEALHGGSLGRGLMLRVGRFAPT